MDTSLNTDSPAKYLVHIVELQSWTRVEEWFCSFRPSSISRASRTDKSLHRGKDEGVLMIRSMKLLAAVTYSIHNEWWTSQMDSQSGLGWTKLVGGWTIYDLMPQCINPNYYKYGGGCSLSFSSRSLCTSTANNITVFCIRVRTLGGRSSSGPFSDPP